MGKLKNIFKLKKNKSMALPIIYASILIFIFPILFFKVHELRSRNISEKHTKEKIKSIIKEMSLEEKIGQLFHIGINGTKIDNKVKKLLRTFKPGGVILFARNFKNLDSKAIRELNSELQKISIQNTGIPLFISTDQEGGRVKRLDQKSTVNFPSAMAFGQSQNATFTKEAALVTAYELRNLGINWVLAPVLDVNNNPSNPVINVRSFGSQAKLVSEMGKAYLEGNQIAFSTSAVKHFPGHGDTNIDSHYDLPTIHRNIEELQKIELLPFQMVIQEGKAEVVMTAHILFPNLDKENPATLSPNVIKKLLRKKLKFQGLVSTDAMEMKALSKRYKPAQAARLAFLAGADILLLSKNNPLLRRMYYPLLKDFHKGKLSLKDLEKSIQRQLHLKWKKALFYRWSSPFFSQGKASIERWNKKEALAQSFYQEIQNKYKKKGIDLNIAVSRASITSLEKAYQSFSLVQSSKAQFLLGSQGMKTQALKMGISYKQISSLPRPQNLFKLAKSQKKILVIELSSLYIPYWNKLIELENKKETHLQKEWVALYSDNPFLNIKVPNKGAVLASYSKTTPSKNALVYKLLYPQKLIPKANLILKKINNDLDTTTIGNENSP